MIERGNQHYFENCLKFDKSLRDFNEIESIKYTLKTNQIKCIKYNNTIDKNVKTRCNYAYLQLSQDEQSLIITKLLVNPEFQDLRK
jgi:hypothetical protein